MESVVFFTCFAVLNYLGYYMATLEAALQHILDLADEYSTSLTSLSSQYQSSL